MLETIIESVLSGKLDSVLLIKWLNNESIDDAPDDCILHCCKSSEFVGYFLTFLRNQTDSILQTNTNAVQILQNSTPEKIRQHNHHRSTSEPTSDERSDTLTVKSDSLTVKSDIKSHESPSRDRKKTGRRVKTKLFADEQKDSNVSISSDESRLSLSADRLATSTSTSTPLKNGSKISDYPSLTSPVTPRSFIKDNYERCDTPRVSRHSRSHEKSCLGDYLATATKSTKKKTKKNTSSDKEESKTELDISNSEMFPEIGARKSSSLRSEKRRIKPTNIDKSQKSLSLNSFNTDCFQQPSSLALEDNSAFKQQKYETKTTETFETERNILRQERHKLMEKFNILTTNTPTKPISTPQIKITQKDSFEKPNYTKADVTKIIFKDKIDLLIELYDIMMKNNLILSMNTEIYFLISILISKQLEDDYFNVEKELNDNNIDYLLRSIHNCTYFAVKALWNEKSSLEAILDKNSLKTLGENKKVRQFSPELAKFLLNCYCVRCEAPRPLPPPTLPPPVVCYNVETDNIDNFQGNNQYHAFKKQRDMFYDIVRWYTSSSSTSSTSSVRSRVRALLSTGATHTHPHLAALFVQHLLCMCVTDARESKLSKLHRRLTCPTAADSHRLPHFTNTEIFYKEFIINADNESFRAHLKDSFSTEIIILDSTHIATEDRGNSKNISLEYLNLAKKLAVLAKFLGFLTALPYTTLPTEIINKNNNNKFKINKDDNYMAPKEKVLENNLALRNYSQPNIDLKSILENAIENNRLIITLPWLIHYLSMLDYTTLRTKYYQKLLKIIYQIYHRLRPTEKLLKKNTIIYLKSILGWLFDLPHFPTDTDLNTSVVGKDIDIFNSNASVVTDCIDNSNFIDESVILELCPSLKDINLLLTTCRLTKDTKEGSFRHITPVSLNVNPEDRIKNKERELQSRLEEEFLRSQPSSWRRILDIVCERSVATVCRELATQCVRVANIHRDGGASSQTDQSNLLQTLGSNALETGSNRLRARIQSALSALLPAAPQQLHAVAYRKARVKLQAWLNDHWNTTAIVGKDMESFVQSVSQPSVESVSQPRVLPSVSFANHIIEMKEHICLLLDGGAPSRLSRLLSTSATLAKETQGVQRRTHLQITVDLCFVYVAKKPKEVTEAFLNKLHAVWNTYCPERKPNTPEEISFPERREGLSPELRNFDDDERAPTPISDEENNDKQITVQNNQITVQNNQITVLNSPITVQNNQITVQNNQITVQNNQITVLNSPITVLNSPITSSNNSIGPKRQNSASNISITGCKSPKSASNRSNNLFFGPNIPITKSNSAIIGPTSPNSANHGPYSPIIVKTNQITVPKRSISVPNSPTVKTSAIIIPVLPITPLNTAIISQNRAITTQNKPISNLNSPITKTNRNEESDQLLEFFDRILCPRNLVLFSVAKSEQSEVWDALAQVLVFLLRNDYLSEDSLTEQCLAVYRQDWNQTILENMSKCMKTVSSKWSRSPGKFTLFLDFLAEYCGNMDYEPVNEGSWEC